MLSDTELDALEKRARGLCENVKYDIKDGALWELADSNASLRRQLAEVITERDQARMDLTNERAKKSDDTFDAYNDLASANKAIDSLQSQLTAEREKADEVSTALQVIGMALGSSDEWSDHHTMIYDVCKRFDAALAEARELRRLLRESAGFVASRLPDCVAKGLLARIDAKLTEGA
jgi:DNA repair exonuclease SbcCD ATPase subunit